MSEDAVGGQTAASVANGAGKQRAMKRKVVAYLGRRRRLGKKEGGSRRRRREMVRHRQRQRRAHTDYIESSLARTSLSLSQPRSRFRAHTR